MKWFGAAIILLGAFIVACGGVAVGLLAIGAGALIGGEAWER